MKKFFAIFLVVAVSGVRGETVRTENFFVDAPTPKLAREIAKQAEVHRETIANRLTGGTLPTWRTPCLLFVSLQGKPWAWTYHFNGDLRGISIRGSREEVFNRSLPHEITHAILVTYFGSDVPRWADEGMAVASEKDCPCRLRGRCGNQSLRELFSVTSYPDDWELFYGQSYSVVNYLVNTYGREKFLTFVRMGIRDGWESACQHCFKLSVSELDTLWNKWIKRNDDCGV